MDIDGLGAETVALLVNSNIIRNYSDLHNNYGKYVSFPSKATEMMKSRIGVMVYSQTRDPHGNPI